MNLLPDKIWSFSRHYQDSFYLIFFFLFSVFFIFNGEVTIPNIEAAVLPSSRLSDPAFFPLGVSLQIPNNAAKFKALGINFYAGLYRGPTTQQLQELQEAGMALICYQNEIALNTAFNDIIMGWGQQGEPDNSQERKFGIFYTPPISPSIIKERYADMKARDPNRPILLNLGQGVAWDQWWGRGWRTNHPEDYKEYVQGGDIISFDIYPVTHKHPSVRGKLEFVARGVQRLKSLASPNQKVWNVIGVSRIHDPVQKPTPLQVRSQVWMSIIHGSHGIIYFVHQFKPRFIEAAIFEDPEMMQEITRLNGLIQSLAVVLNSPDTHDIKSLKTTSPDVPVAAITKRRGPFLYLLSVAMRNMETTSSFEFRYAIADQEAEVLGENRKVSIRKNILEDHYEPYEPHIYKIYLRGDLHSQNRESGFSEDSACAHPQYSLQCASQIIPNSLGQEQMQLQPALY